MLSRRAVVEVAAMTDLRLNHTRSALGRILRGPKNAGLRKRMREFAERRAQSGDEPQAICSGLLTVLGRKILSEEDVRGVLKGLERDIPAKPKVEPESEVACLPMLFNADAPPSTTERPPFVGSLPDLPGRIYNEAYLEEVRALRRCEVARYFGLHVAGPCEGVFEADHAGERPYGRKSDDDTAICVCSLHHKNRTDYKGPFDGWTGAQMRAWCDPRIEETRAIVLPTLARRAGAEGRAAS